MITEFKNSGFSINLRCFFSQKADNSGVFKILCQIFSLTQLSPMVAEVKDDSENGP